MSWLGPDYCPGLDMDAPPCNEPVDRFVGLCPRHFEEKINRILADAVFAGAVRIEGTTPHGQTLYRAVPQ